MRARWRNWGWNERAARTHHARTGLRAAQPRVPRHQPYPRRVQRRAWTHHLVRARRARAQIETGIAADAVPAAAGVVERARRRGATHRRRAAWRAVGIALA